MPNLPPALARRLQQQLGEQYPQFLGVLQQPLTTGIRFNPLKPLSPEAEQAVLADLHQGEWHAVPWLQGAFWIGEQVEKPGLHPAHLTGAFYVQDPSAMAPAVALNAQPGERVIDLAAAPGGKATQLAAAIGPHGTLYANEIDKTRAKVLIHNSERLGAANTIVTSERTSTLAAAWPGAFDRVMLDAPCSGEGMLKKHEEASRQWSEKLVADLAALQRILLADAATLTAPGGVICYSTCTFSLEENELLVEQFLREHPNFQHVPAKTPTGAPLPERFWPHEQPGEGQFLALLRRNSSDEAPRTPKGAFNRHVTAPKPAMLRAWKDFQRATFVRGEPTWLAQYELVEFRGKLLALPPHWLPSQGIRVVRAGLQLGELRGNRFVPHHALAVAADPSALRSTFELSPEQLEQYLRGETLSAQAVAGYGAAVTVGGTLGWYRANRTEVRSLYPRGLRRDTLAAPTR